MASPILLTIASVFKSAGLNQARQALQGAQKDFGGLASAIGQTAGAFGAFQALASAREFAVDSVIAAQKFERNILALKQVFEDATPSLLNFTKQVESYGLSQAQAAQASVFLGSVLKQYGFSVSESSDQTQRLVKLSQDLATTYGYDVQEALLAVTALFRGEYDPIEKFGVAMKQSEVSARVASKGLGELTNEQEANAMAVARLELLYERSEDSFGAFTRATDTLYGAQQRLNAEMGNLQLAFGAPLQKPVAAVIEGFAELADRQGPELVEVSVAIGNALENITPTILKLGETSAISTTGSQQLVEALGGLASALTSLVNPALDALNFSLEQASQFGDTWSSRFELASQRVDRSINNSELAKFLLMLDGPREDARLIQFLKFLEEDMIRNEQAAKAASGNFATFTDGAKAASVSIRAAGLAARDAAANVDVVAESTSYFEMELQSLGMATQDAEGKLIGLAGVFAEIDEAARKSDASGALDEIGFSAAQIEQILTRPDWATIFGEISRLALLAAYDISKATTLAMAIGIDSAQRALKELLDSFTGGRGTSESPAKNFVQDFLTDLTDEVNKQTARGKLESLGIASEGLLNEIFGSEGYQEIYERVLKGGTKFLKDLQTQFEKTADGLREISDAVEEERKKQEKEATDQLRAFEAQREAMAEFNEMAERRVALMVEFRQAIRDISLMDVLSENERQIGRYESSVAGFFDSIMSSLEDAFANEVILKDAFDELKNYANAEKAVFTAIQRQRDELAERINLSEALINEYRGAFTGATNLVSLLGQIESKTKKVTVSEMTEGMVTLTGSLKEFKVTLTRSFEEASEETVDKTTKLISDFRNIADKARTFAQNLRVLRDMGLNPMLFNQLVAAGVEAGGETAQALVDGGVDTVNEISSLFAEIDSIGASLGEDVAATLYGSGVDMANGLLNGLKSQAEALKSTAESLAMGFADAFTAKIDAAVAEALAKLSSLNVQATGPSVTFIDTSQLPTGNLAAQPGMPQLPAGLVAAPLPLPRAGLTQPGGFGTVQIFTDSRYGGYQAATAFTAQQSRLATNNAGISSFMKI